MLQLALPTKCVEMLEPEDMAVAAANMSVAEASGAR